MEAQGESTRSPWLSALGPPLFSYSVCPVGRASYLHKWTPWSSYLALLQNISKNAFILFLLSGAVYVLSS
jgi:hypothetical protein